MNSNQTIFSHYPNLNWSRIPVFRIVLVTILLETILLSCDPTDDGTTDGTSGATGKSSSVLK
jgi:hypothetical protein